MPARTYPDPNSSNELNGTHNDQEGADENELNGTHNGQEDSEEYASDTPDASMTQLEEINDFPGYFLEVDNRLFPSALSPYPFPVDTPEQDVRYQCCPT